MSGRESEKNVLEFHLFGFLELASHQGDAFRAASFFGWDLRRGFSFKSQTRR